MRSDHEREFREFVAQRSGALMRLGYLLTGGDQQQAEDLVQSALTKAAMHWRRIRDPEAYLRKAIYHEQVGIWRRLARRRETAVADPPYGSVDDPAAATADRLAVRDALRRLTVRQRTVLVLRYFEDLPEGQVADVLGCSIGTVRSTGYRALQRLRQIAPELAPAQETQR